MIDAAFANRYFETHRQTILDDWFALLRIPTVGADPKRLGECARATAWLKKFLKPLGFEVEILTPGSGLPVPVLVAERPGREGVPTVLFYGHYDVQPPDPEPFLDQQTLQHPAARKWEFHVQLVDAVHQLQVGVRHRAWLVVNGSPADSQHDGLAADA